MIVAAFTLAVAAAALLVWASFDLCSRALVAYRTRFTHTTHFSPREPKNQAASSTRSSM